MRRWLVILAALAVQSAYGQVRLPRTTATEPADAAAALARPTSESSTMEFAVEAFEQAMRKNELGRLMRVKAMLEVCELPAVAALMNPNIQTAMQPQLAAATLGLDPVRAREVRRTAAILAATYGIAFGDGVRNSFDASAIAFPAQTKALRQTTCEQMVKEANNLATDD